MAFHPADRALSLRQLQTPSNQAARSAAKSGGVIPPLPSQQFSIQAGLEQLTEAEQGALRKVVARLRARQQGGTRRRASAVSALGGALQPISVAGRTFQAPVGFVPPTVTPGLLRAFRGFFEGT